MNDLNHVIILALKALGIDGINSAEPDTHDTRHAPIITPEAAERVQKELHRLMYNGDVDPALAAGAESLAGFINTLKTGFGAASAFRFNDC